MEITDTPCVKHLGIRRGPDGSLQLADAAALHNHLRTIHAGALFTLAETASAEALRVGFPDLVENVIPVIRDAQIRLRKPAIGTVSAFPALAEDDKARCRAQLARKGRASIRVDVALKDVNGTTVLTGSFNWFVQGRD